MHVFISHNNADKEAAKRVVEALYQPVGRFSCYFAPRSNIGGAHWLPLLGKELERADVVLPLVGQRVGPWQELEYYEALRLEDTRQRPRIVPILLGEDSPGLPFLWQFHAPRAPQLSFNGLVADVVQAVEDSVPASERIPAWRETNPYRGLDAMDTTDVAFVFGREDLTVSRDRTARLWDAETGAPAPVLQGHERAVRSAVPSLVGRWILTDVADGAVRLRDAVTGAPGPVLRRPGEVLFAGGLSPDGRWIVTTSTDRTVQLWDAASGASGPLLDGHNGEVRSTLFCKRSPGTLLSRRGMTVLGRLRASCLEMALWTAFRTTRRAGTGGLRF
jgi:hypothetical protein